MPQKNSEGQDRESKNYGFIADSGDWIHLKYCYMCGEDLPTYEFYPDSCSHDGIRTQCKICKSESSKQWYIKNKTYRLKTVKQYYQKNKHSYLEQKKRYYWANRDKRIEQMKQYRLRKKAEVR